MWKRSIEAMSRRMILWVLMMGSIGWFSKEVQGFSVIGEQTLIYVDDQGTHAYNMTTLTCNAGESFFWNWNGKSYNFSCGTVEHVYSVQHRTYVPFDTRTYVNKVCFPMGSAMGTRHEIDGHQKRNRGGSRVTYMKGTNKTVISDADGDEDDGAYALGTHIRRDPMPKRDETLTMDRLTRRSDETFWEAMRLGRSYDMVDDMEELMSELEQQEPSRWGRQLVLERRKQRMRRYRACDGWDAIPGADIIRGACIDPATAKEIEQMNDIQNKQEKQIDIEGQIQKGQMDQLIQLKKDAVENMDIMQKKFGDYEQKVYDMSVKFLKKLDTTINQALEQWQQEADDFVYFTNFRMKTLLYNWRARLKFMQHSLQDRIGWTYDLVQANIRQVNSFYQALVDILYTVQRRHMGDMLIANNMQSLMDSLIQILIGFGHVTERYYAMEAMAKAANYRPFLGVPGYAPGGLDSISPVGEVFLNDTYRIVIACSQCPNCTDPSLQNYDCRPYYRVGECPAVYMDCESTSSAGSVIVNGVSLVLFRPRDNNYTGTVGFYDSRNSGSTTTKRSDPESQQPSRNRRMSQDQNPSEKDKVYALNDPSLMEGTSDSPVPPSNSSNEKASDDVITFKGTNQLLLILQAKSDNYIALMQTFFGQQPIYWRTTLPEGLIVTEEPSNIFGGEESIKCKEILFGAIRDDLVPMVPVRSMRLIHTKYVGNSLIEDDGITKTPHDFHSAYYEDPYETYLPVGEQNFIQHRSNNSDVDLVIAPPFDYVNLNPSPLSRMGSATYLFNSSADFSFENNTLPNYDPYGFAISPSMFVSAYDPINPWCGSSNINIEDDDKPSLGALKTRYGSNLCTLSDYYDIQERDVDEDGNSIISIRAKSDAIVRYVFKLKIELDYKDIKWACPSSLSDPVLKCAGEVCVMNLYNGIMAPTVFQVNVDAGCDKRTMSLSLAAGSTGHFTIQLCPGKPYNVTVFTKNIGTNTIQDVCFSETGFIDTQYYGEIQDHIANAIQKLNITYQRKTLDTYQKRSQDMVSTKSDQLQKKMNELQMTTGNYTIDDIVNNFNFTVDNAMLDKFLRTQAVYKSLESVDQIKAKFTNYSVFFDQMTKELQNQIDQEAQQQMEFEKQFEKLRREFDNITGGQSSSTLTTGMIIIGLLAVSVICVVLYLLCKPQIPMQPSKIVNILSKNKTDTRPDRMIIFKRHLPSNKIGSHVQRQDDNGDFQDKKRV